MPPAARAHPRPERPPPAAVRAHLLALALETLRDTRPEVGRRGHAELAEAVAHLEACGRLQWVPVDLLLGLARLGSAELGPEGLRRLVLDTMGRALGSPPFRGLLQALIDGLGLTPPQVARWAPRVHALAFRGVGRMVVPEADARRALVVFEGVPPQCLAAPAYVASLGHALEFFFELTGTTGRVRRVERPARDELTFELHLDSLAKPSG